MGAWHTNESNADDPCAWSDLLPRWDELSADALRTIEADPIAGADLRMLQRAEEWLHSRCAPASACPSAEELYDHGGGPGAQAVSSERREEITEHLAACAECEALSLTLDLNPPLPLALTVDETQTPVGAPRSLRAVHMEPPAGQGPGTILRNDAPPKPPVPQPEPVPDDAPLRTHPRWQRNARRLAPAAAAAGLLTLGLVATYEGGASSDAGGAPSAPLLRGEASSPLLFPRGPVLAGCAFDSAPAFELADQPGASEYRIVLHRHDGSAFSAGEEVLRAESPSNLVRAGLSLSPGHYTWEAWAVVDGLNRSLGSRDFQVIGDTPLLGKVKRTSGAERIRLLHDAGYPTDARHLAWSLPESSFRNEYLQLVPGR